MDEGKVLGKTVGYPAHYCPEILVPIPRYLNRELYGITTPDTLFTGYDVWHAFECSTLTNTGVPISFILKIIYPSESEFIIESKSLKLYLASFNMEKMGANGVEAQMAYTERVKMDLERVLQTSVQVIPFNSAQPQIPLNEFKEYTSIDNELANGTITITDYKENPQILIEGNTTQGVQLYKTDLLKSNCKVTKQPDWGSVYLYIKGSKIPSIESFVKYIISLRDENHFHEEICELIYKRVHDIFKPDELAVTCLYTRRGGIDICPTRVSHKYLLNKTLTSREFNDSPTFRR
jgi:7-cyano-7-deazaguanine reductase